MKNVYKLIAFALPISASMLMGMIGSFFAMMMVATLGKQELAAGALAVSTYMTLTAVVGALFYAVSILASHARGQNKTPVEIGTIAKNGYWLAILLSLPISMVLWNADTALLFFGQDLQLVRLTQSYFHYAALSLTPLLMNTVIFQFQTGIGNPRFAMKISIISLLLSVFLSYSFILGKFGLPLLGLGGVTCSVFIIQSIVCIYLMAYLYAGEELKKYAIFSGRFWPTLFLCKTILILGIPIGIQFGAELAALSVATYFMGYFGVVALAASQVVSQYVMLFIMITLGLSQGLSALISQAYGKQDIVLIKQYLVSTLFIFSMLGMIIFSLFFLAPRWLIAFYLNANDANNPELTHLVIIFFMIAAVMLIVDGARNLLSGALRGLHDSKAPMRICVICLWCISLPVSYFAAFTLNMGPIGLRIGFISGFLLAVMLLWRRIRKRLELAHFEEVAYVTP